MGITRKIKAMALVLAILLMASAAACGGDEDGDSSPKELVPQRANVVGTVDIDQFLEELGLGLAQVFQLLASESVDGLEGMDDILNLDAARMDALFGDASRADIFAEADADGDSEYFGVVLRGSFDETALIAEVEALTGSDLLQEVRAWGLRHREPRCLLSPLRLVTSNQRPRS